MVFVCFFGSLFSLWLFELNSTSGRHNSCGNGNRNLGVKYINLHFPNDYYNVITDRTSGATGFSPSGHVNSQGYVRHSGFGVDSANTEATLISHGSKY